MIKRLLATTLGLVIMASVLFSCRDNDDDDNSCCDSKPEFDRHAMLSNIGNNIIISNYQVLKTESNEFNAAATTFNTTTDSVNLITLRNGFKELYTSWQLCSVFEFGPAETELLRMNLNTFPTDTAQVKTNISSGSYNLGTASNIDAKGLPAIDYLLFGTSFSTTLKNFTTDADAANRKAYLLAVSNEINQKVNNVYNGWISSGGNYINTFINNPGTDVGSALGELVNQINYDFEIIKGPKIGIPLGKKTLGTPLPEKTEAYYSGISVQLALKNIKAIENTYLGRDRNNNDGLGLDDYLTFLEAQHTTGPLPNAIRDQFARAINKLQQIPDPLSSAVVNNSSVVDAAYVELQKLVVLLKTDMPSAMGVLITYQDNDGD